MTAKTNFVRQQGLAETPAETSSCQYSALMWQPRIVGILVLIGLILQPWPYFLRAIRAPLVERAPAGVESVRRSLQPFCGQAK